VDLRQFFTQPRLHFVVGKGGAGKTTVTAALALSAAWAGLDVVVIEVDGRGELARRLGAAPFSAAVAGLQATEPYAAAQRIRGVALHPDEALAGHLRDRGHPTLARTMRASGLVDIVTRGVPGIGDIVVLGRIKQLERDLPEPVLIVDAPASGHAVSFLRTPAGLVDAVAAGVIHDQAREVVDLLHDHARAQVLLVTTPERTPVNETVQTAFRLEDEAGVSLGPVIVNGVTAPLAVVAAAAGFGGNDGGSGGATVPEVIARLRAAGIDAVEAGALAAAAAYRTARHERQIAFAEELAHRLPLPQVRLPHLLGRRWPRSLEPLAAALRSGVAALERETPLISAGSPSVAP